MATILQTQAYTFDDILLKPQYSELSSRDQADISVELVPGIKLENPIMSSNMQSVNSVELAIEVFRNGGMSTIDQFRSVENQITMIREVKASGAKVAGAIGTSKNFLERAEALVFEGVEVVIMDTPHAHNSLTKEAIKKFKEKFKDNIALIVGNIATKEAALFLIHHGVDGIKVGIGPGGACLTRVNAGSGAPQVTALMECYDVARNRGIGIIADGGVKTPGNFAKAIAVGGSAVYMGSVFAGSAESPGKIIELNGAKYKEYFGSSSEIAKTKRAEADSDYKEKNSRYVEGGAGLTPYNGKVSEIMEKFAMGLKSAMSYTGAENIRDFQQKAVVTIITQNSFYENGTHSIVKYSIN